ITDLGNYTLKQLNAMQGIYILQETCKHGMQLISWIQSEFAGVSTTEVLVQSLQQHHSHVLVKGFELQFLDFSHVYRTPPGLWLSEPLFHALDVVWSNYNVDVFTLPVMEKDTITRIPKDNALYIARSTTTWSFFLPVNLGRNHWVAIAIDRSPKKIFVYNSMSAYPDKDVLHKVVVEIQALPTL
ncbi:Cysteine protease, partial [Phytophthora megakarya]